MGDLDLIWANLYAEIVALRPDRHSDELTGRNITVVYSGTPADPIAAHVRRDSASATIKKWLKDVDDELELGIVKDMMPDGPVASLRCCSFPTRARGQGSSRSTF